MTKSVYTHLTKEQEDEVAKLYKRGYPVEEIVKDFHISYWKVYNCLDKHNIPRTIKVSGTIRQSDFSRLTEEDLYNISKDLSEGKLTDDEISLKYHLGTEHTLREIKVKQAFLPKYADETLAGLDDVDYD